MLCCAMLSEATNGKLMCTGGWFIFEKGDRWAYRSNEFSNAGCANLALNH